MNFSSFSVWTNAFQCHSVSFLLLKKRSFPKHCGIQSMVSVDFECFITGNIASIALYSSKLGFKKLWLHWSPVQSSHSAAVLKYNSFCKFFSNGLRRAKLLMKFFVLFGKFVDLLLHLYNFIIGMKWLNFIQDCTITSQDCSISPSKHYDSY